MTHYPNPSSVQTFEKEQCAYCDLCFTKNQGRLSLAEFPGEVFHLHCLKLFKDDNKALYDKKLPVSNSKEKTKEVKRKLYTKGKRKNSKALSM